MKLNNWVLKKYNISVKNIVRNTILEPINSFFLSEALCNLFPSNCVAAVQKIAPRGQAGDRQQFFGKNVVARGTKIKS